MTHLVAPFALILSLAAPVPKGAAQRHAANKTAAVHLRMVFPNGSLGLGTGTVVDRRGFVLTNAHVIADSADPVQRKMLKPVIYVCENRVPGVTVPEPAPRQVLEIMFLPQNMACRKGVKIAADAALDLALIKVEHRYPSAISLADDPALPEAAEVYARVALSDQLPPVKAPGHFLGWVDPGHFPPGRGPKHRFPMFSFPIKQGSSGGPVFVAASGKMIGLASAFAGGPGTAIAAAIPVELIRPFLTAHVPPE